MVYQTHFGVGAGARDVDVYQMTVDGYVYNLIVGEGCIPISDSYYGTTPMQRKLYFYIMHYFSSGQKKMAILSGFYSTNNRN